MDAAPELDLRVPFTRAEALAAGITPWQLRGRRFVRVFHGVYVSRAVPRTVALRSRAALRVAPDGSVVSHHTAALLWEGSVPESSLIHVTIGDQETLAVAGIQAHRTRRELPVGRRHGVAVTSPEQTFLDLAATLDLVQLVTLGDRLVRRSATTVERLSAAAATWDGARSSLARRAAGLVRAGVDSPPESRLRMLVVLAGLPEPTVNLILRDPATGEWVRRFELAYEELKLAIEYEGRQHRDNDDIWSGDIERREDLDRRAWRVVQVISDGLHQDPLRTLQRIEQARVDRGAPRTRAFREEWRRYFPGRAVA